MSEWWTYRLGDFLMFSPRTYWRLVELYNRQLWPAQLAAALAGVALLWLVLARRAAAAWLVPAALALAWLWVGWAFHWQRYATINWGAHGLAVAWAAEAALLGLAAWRQAAATVPPSQRTTRPAALLLALAAVVVYPFLRVVAGAPLAQAEVFGLMPEPTALATLGLLAALRPRRWPWLIVLPIASLLVGAATAWVLAAA
ncbi:DUF6064 family protein [Ramlibacter sp.]|uniref:DUF6064 family protein n=1 Tax=Ramlibacter sp. TaxID=1917967 RepID=UPI002CFFD908|nr:DUF6064 family protein [Ramlibacter sp.]HWI83054.1 DUF6064 family protein [Ramlibacter sp.]